MPVSSTTRKKRAGQNTGSMKKGEKVNLTGPVRKTGTTVTPREKASRPNPSRKVMYDASVMDQYRAWKRQPSTKKGKKVKTGGPVGRAR